MKTVYYLCLTGFLLVALPQHIMAQQLGLSSPGTAFTKGAKQFTMTYGYGQGQLVKNRSVTQIQAGYYVVDRLMIGITGSFGLATFDWRRFLGTFGNKPKSTHEKKTCI